MMFVIASIGINAQTNVTHVYNGNTTYHVQRYGNNVYVQEHNVQWKTINEISIYGTQRTATSQKSHVGYENYDQGINSRRTGKSTSPSRKENRECNTTIQIYPRCETNKYPIWEWKGN